MIHSWHGLCWLSLQIRMAVFRHWAGKKHEKNVQDLLSEQITRREHHQRFKKKYFRLTQGAFTSFLERVETMKEEQANQKEQAVAQWNQPVLVENAPLPSLDMDRMVAEQEAQSDNVRPEIKALVAAANAISAKKKNKNAKRHRHKERATEVCFHSARILEDELMMIF